MKIKFDQLQTHFAWLHHIIIMAISLRFYYVLINYKIKLGMFCVYKDYFNWCYNFQDSDIFATKQRQSLLFSFGIRSIWQLKELCSVLQIQSRQELW